MGRIERDRTILHHPRFGELGAREHRVLRALELHAAALQSQAVVWPSVQRISKIARVEIRGTRRALLRLEELGMIEIQPHSGRRSRSYRIAPESGAERVPPTPARETDVREQPTLFSGQNQGVQTTPPDPVEGVSPVRRGGLLPLVEREHRTGLTQNLRRTPASDAGPDSRSQDLAAKLLVKALNAGARAKHPKTLARAVSQFAIDGGTESEFDRLVLLAVEIARDGNPTAMLIRTLRDPYEWKSIRDDAWAAAKRAEARARPIARDLDGQVKTNEPRAVSGLIPAPPLRRSPNHLEA